MKRLLILSSLILCISTFAQNQNYERHWKDGVEKVRIMSYNIFNGFDWGKDKDRETRFVNYIKSQDPEVLALQELCGFTQASLEEIALKWGHPYAVIVKENGYPVGITSKKPIEVKRKFTEGFGHGLLHVKTYGYDFLVTHLNPGSTDKRRDEARRIVAYISEQKLDSCLLMGDMNAHSPFDADYLEANATNLIQKYGGASSPNLLDGEFDYSIISTFMSTPLLDACHSFVEADKRTTFPTLVLMGVSRNEPMRKKQSERIDYIFISPSLSKNLVDAFIYNEGTPDYLSDHYPVAIDLCIDKK